METFYSVLAIVYIAVCGIICGAAQWRRLNPLITFLVSFFFTPIIGLIILFLSPHEDDIRVQKEILEELKKLNNK